MYNHTFWPIFCISPVWKNEHPFSLFSTCRGQPCFLCFVLSESDTGQRNVSQSLAQGCARVTENWLMCLRRYIDNEIVFQVIWSKQ